MRGATLCALCLGTVALGCRTPIQVGPVAYHYFERPAHDDAWSRKIVGWKMASHLRAELVLDALDMAVRQRQPVGVIHHSDKGCQYTSLAFGHRCRAAGVRPSTGSVGAPLLFSQSISTRPSG